MSDKNEVEFRVRVTDDGLAPLATKLDRVDQATDDLGKSAATTGKQLDGIGKTADPALDTVYRRGRKAAEGIDSISLQLQRVQNALIALGVGDSFLTMIKGAADTADSYNNLASRIQLATGAGELFEESMQAVEQIALDTNSSLEGTGDLFARLTEAGKSAGLGTQEAVSQALELTESINQAVQVSGAGAQASDAALRQLIQGLQGGTLRGDEFNSVMEQSPRLAKALADGLGVTTGQLRAMANEGRLTSDVVIQSLKSQADTLKREFETLPPTVGRAVQNLSTAWTVYVGNADKATGASKTAAEAINLLAENLDTIAGYLIDAGQAAAAFAALKLAQTFLGIGAAATASATAISANAVAMTAANAASAGAAVGLGRFASLLSSIRTFTFLGLITNIQDIGTWIGVAIAKLQGYKDVAEDVERAERSRIAVADEQRKVVEAQAAAVKLAAERQFELSNAAQLSIAAFDDLLKSGKKAADAVAEIGKDFDLSSLPGISNAAAVLDKLAADGKLSADQVRQAWADALKGEDLQAFEVRARAALSGTARETERVAVVMDATLREAIRRSGSDFDVLAGGMGRAARSAINDTDTIIAAMGKLKSQGVDVADALQASLSKAVSTADGQKSVDALRERIERMRTELGEKVTDGLLSDLQKQADKLGATFEKLPDKAKTYADRVADAFKESGIKTQAELDSLANDAEKRFLLISTSGKASADGVKQAWQQMAEASIAANGGVASETLKAEAATYGLEIQVDKTGKAIVKAMGEGREQTNRYRDAVEDAAKASRGLGDAIDREYANRMANKFAIDAETRALAAQAEQKRLGVDAEKFIVDAKGNRIVQEVNNRASAASKLESMGVDPQAAKQLAAKVYDERGNYTPKSSGAYRDGDTLEAVLARLASKADGTAGVGRGSMFTYEDGSQSYDLNNRMRKNVEEGRHPWDDGGAFTSVGGSRSAQASGTPVGTSHTVTINFGDTSRTINTASRSDADSLKDFLTSLGHAKMSSQ